MKKLFTYLSILSLILFVFSLAYAETPPQPKDQLKSPVDKDKLKQIKPIPPPKCPDPAVQRIDFTVVSKTSQFSGKVRITGVVKNMGVEPYISGPNQQAVYLYEIPMGGKANLVATKKFQNLNPGQEITVSYERNWNASSPSEGEFPPSYRVVIAYDPDIRMDSNPKNDDCNMNNNQKERSGTEINALFR
ncbi:MULTISPECIES: hypothetical protein [Thermodesulfovibrio]|jgi:hypothetical protein|uniref:CARDB domain-containing protein n=2 Tax=Thermodesulfovibrio yellowstonii TaxID=28262 RepID=B5YHD7_THEYD|nr:MULTISPECIES: hypothetical protein [Thermodesulfovibrio]ACI21234.1 hypothetical protein THEYE_A0107 [Thermodesulfovibrio yellowstonii DSM 11347]MDI6865453.1 hypothetical protein [Thermodesulfovibrio yellowstonii]GLI52643.1 hypothetical protein TISLANDTSLP1_03360 [Thermodesulfovibrio islandicus]